MGKEIDKKIEELTLLMIECNISREIMLTVADYLPNESYDEMIEFVKSNRTVMTELILLSKLVEIKEIKMLKKKLMVVTKEHDKNLAELWHLMKETGISKKIATEVVTYLPAENYREMIDFVKSSFILMSDYIILMRLLEIRKIPFKDFKKLQDPKYKYGKPNKWRCWKILFYLRKSSANKLKTNKKD